MPRPFDPAALPRLPSMANLATITPERPRNAPVWFICEDAALWMLGSASASSVLRRKANPSAAVKILHFADTVGRLPHLGFRGNATVEGPDPGRFRRLPHRYPGPDPAG